MKIDEAFELLNIDSSSTPEIVTKRWQSLRSELHPDKGGNDHDFFVGRQAYEVALEEAERVKPCVTCNGTGKIRVGLSAASAISILCQMCHGSKVFK